MGFEFCAVENSLKWCVVMVAAKAFGVTEFLNPKDCKEPIQQVFIQGAIKIRKFFYNIVEYISILYNDIQKAEWSQ